jgi:branched-chain amino acid transport system permease protein
MARMQISDYFAHQSRWGGWEYAFWLLWIVLFFVPDSNLVLLTQILIWGLFAMSLDVLLGYRGIPSLGHAAFFGIGAYSAGFLGKYGWTEPISGLLISALITGCAGLAMGRVVRGLHGVALLMVTLGLNMILFDFVQRSTDITGGDDGLQDIVIAPVLGMFRFDMYGKTAYVYVLVVVFIVTLLVRALVNSPFGLTLRGSRESTRRMIMLGAPVDRDVTLAFGVSAAIAGIAGALLAQTTQFVAPEMVAFTRSADVLVMLVIGGTAVLYGGYVGAAVFLVLRDVFAAMNPVYWYFWIGLLLVVIVALFRQGILPKLAEKWTRFREGR